MPNELKPCRDRLIELLKASVYGNIDEGFDGPELNFENVADYILANGVFALDTSVISPKNRPLITHFAGMPINDVLDLVRAKQEGRLIVPPCKVGDTVYVVDGTTDGIVIGVITHLEYNIYTTPREWITVRGTYPFFGELDFKDRIDVLLGKTVFLTKEEAEAKLKEREGNG